MTIELMCRIVYEIKVIQSYRKIYMPICGIIMIILTLIQIFMTPNADITVNGSIDFTCKWQSDDSKLNYYYYSLPYLIIYLIGTFITFWFLYVLIRTSLKINQNNINSIFKNYRTLLISCYLFIGIFPLTLIFIQPYYSLSESNVIFNSSVEWVTCLLMNFKSSSSKEYLHICGNYPEKRYPVSLPYVMWGIFYVFTPMCNLYISYTNEIHNIYKEKLTLLLKYLPCLNMISVYIVGMKKSNKIIPVEVLNGKEKNNSDQQTNELIVANESGNSNKNICQNLQSEKYKIIELKKETEV